VVLVFTAVAIRPLTIPCGFVNARDRAAAWIVTGPLGHLWSVIADLAVLLARYGRARLVARLRR
jgi:hypothetical protein